MPRLSSPMPPSARSAVFLDRDDTLIANRDVTAHTPHPGDLVDPALVQLLPGVAEGLAELKRAGLLLVVVSNQGCVARGVCTIERVDMCNERMRALLRPPHAPETIELDGVYVCPYHPRGTVAPYNTEHPWRKPAPGMLLQAARDLQIDLSGSWMIGDAQRDIDAAIAAGVAKEKALMVGGAMTFLQACKRVLNRRSAHL